MPDNEIAITVNRLSKSFRLPTEKVSSIKSFIVNPFKKRGYTNQKVLRNIDFKVEKGEFFGIVGRNGSGKSTLLKLIAGIYSPNSGTIHINGKLVPFIELGVGFNPELSGRENVYLNGALLGFDRNEMDEKYDEIVNFAELRKFMDQKLKNYSSGMQVRLAFSIAIQAQGDILLLDEVLAVGDASFQKKCFDYFAKLKRNKQTVILVTHDMSAVRQYCDRAMLIEDGEILEIGKVERVAQAYQRQFDSTDYNESAAMSDKDRWGTGKLVCEDASVSVSDKNITVKVSYKANEQLEPPVFGFNVYNSRGTNILEGNTKREKTKTSNLKRGQTVNLQWEFPNVLASDTYSLSVSCCNDSITEFYDWVNEIKKFQVPKVGSTAAQIDPPIQVSLKTGK